MTEKYVILWAQNAEYERRERNEIQNLNEAASDDGRARLGVYELDEDRAAHLAASPAVGVMARSMPASLIEPLTTSGSPSTAWGISAINADTSQYTGAGVKVAILDTGLEAAHPAFNGMNLVTRDFTGTNTLDLNGHGTHCAGTVFGRDFNGLRIGVAKGVTDGFIGKVLDDKGRGTSNMLFQGLQWAIDCEVDIISMSVGFDFPGLVHIKHTRDGWPIDLATSHALELYRENLRMFDAIVALGSAKRAFGGEPLLVAAAGNESKRLINPGYRIAASLPAVSTELPVAAVSQQGTNFYKVASFSNSRPSVSAPGVDILSSWIGGSSKSLSGTSMACPHVAGAAALWAEKLRIQYASKQSGNIVRSYLISSARSNVFGSAMNSVDLGQGLVSCP